MSGGAQGIFPRLLDLARRQNASIRAGDLDGALALAERRRELLQEIQKLDASLADVVPGRFPGEREQMLREIRELDGAATAAVRGAMRDVSDKLSKINTLKVFCRGMCDAACVRGTLQVP